MAGASSSSARAAWSFAMKQHELRRGGLQGLLLIGRLSMRKNLVDYALLVICLTSGTIIAAGNRAMGVCVKDKCYNVGCCARDGQAGITCTKLEEPDCTCCDVGR